MSILSVVGKLTRGLRAGEERLIRHRPDFEGLPVSIQERALPLPMASPCRPNIRFQVRTYPRLSRGAICRQELAI
jgi:hypothetical protein